MGILKSAIAEPIISASYSSVKVRVFQIYWTIYIRLTILTNNLTTIK